MIYIYTTYPKALSTTSVTRCDVNTLPPTTAAVSQGLSTEPGGTFIVIGTRQPSGNIYKVVCYIRYIVITYDNSAPNCIIYMQQI